MTTYIVYGRDECLGEYEAESAEAAIAAAVRDAGYTGVAEMDAVTGHESDLRAEAVRP